MMRRIVPWQTLQRRLAEAVGSEPTGYPVGGGTPQSQWRFASASGSWLNRTRSGVDRIRQPVASP